MLIIKIVGVIILAIAAGLIGNSIELIKRDRKTSIPFKESLDLVGLPIITFKNGSFKMHLLLDTGSEHSFINQKNVKKCKIEKRTENKRSVSTAGGTNECGEIITLNLMYKNEMYTGDFMTIDLSSAFDQIKAENGVTIHGILGCDFFNKYKYKIDFETYTAYV